MPTGRKQRRQQFETIYHLMKTNAGLI